MQLETVQDVGGEGGNGSLSGSVLSSRPDAWLKRRTSSPSCGCGGRASWRRPCPGAAEKEGDGEEASARMQTCILCLSLIRLMLTPSAAFSFLTRNVSRGAAPAPHTAFKRELSNLCDGEA